MSKRYTAIVEIVEVEETGGSNPGFTTRSTYAAREEVVKPTKETRELSKFVVRGNSLEELKAKITGFVDLV